ncbi:primase C-terminal domain-containing protein, partial [Salmonella enterica]
DFLDLNAANDKEIVADYGLGRNCTLFDKTRKWAYRAIRQGWPEYGQWMLACVERATAYNMQFSAPLDEKEVISIAKSISKWTYSKFTQQSFDEYVKKTHSAECQSIRGRKSSGGGRPKIRSEEWVSLGISRATWYRKHYKNEN